MEGVGFSEQWVLFGRGCLGSSTALKPKLGSTLGDLWFFLQLLKLTQCLMPNAHGLQMMCWVSRYCLISIFQRHDILPKFWVLFFVNCCFQARFVLCKHEEEMNPIEKGCSWRNRRHKSRIILHINLYSVSLGSSDTLWDWVLSINSQLL